MRVNRSLGPWSGRVLTVAALCFAALAAGCSGVQMPGQPASQSAPSATSAWSAFRGALAAKQDTDVYAALSDELRATVGSTPVGVSEKVTGMLPPVVATLAPKQVSASETWMVDAANPDDRVELALVDNVWRIKTISAASESKSVQHFTPDPVRHETDHLPRGATVTISNPQGGTREVTQRITRVNGVVTKQATVGVPTIISEPISGEKWIGTGPTYHGPAKITGVKVGSGHGKYGVKGAGSVLSSTKTIAIGFSPHSLPSGSGVRAVLLDAYGRENVGNAMGTGSGAGWVYWWESNSKIEPGGYVAVVEVDSKPAVWKAFWVK